MKNNHFNGSFNKVKSALDKCSCEIKHVYVPYMCGPNDGDVDIEERYVECQACIDELIKDTPEEIQEHLEPGMAFEYLKSKYSIKCTYAMRNKWDDLPF